MATWVESLINRAIEMQDSVLGEFPEEKRRDAYGRAAKVIIDGDGGGIFDLWFTEEGISPKPADVPFRNTIYMTEETFRGLITPDIEIGQLDKLLHGSDMMGIVASLHPRLDPRVARANGLIKISGETSLYDSEEMSQILGKIVREVFFPVVMRAMLKERRKK